MEYAVEISTGFWETLCQMSPYLLFGFLVAGALSVLIPPELVEKHLGGKGLWPVVKASLFGVPLPLCSCGVLPVAVSLRKHGSSKGAMTAFLLSTPQTGVDSIMVTYSLLGPVFAVFRPIAAFIAGLVGGLIVNAVDKREESHAEAEHCHDECCQHGGKKPALTRALRYGFVTLPRDIGNALLVGVLVAGVIGALVPDGLFSAAIGTGIGAMVVMMLAGIPIYVCATASVPIAAAMMAKGVSPGAALVFLMTGPATNAAAFATIWKVMGRRVALVYIGVVAGTALVCGILLDWIFITSIASAPHHAHEMLPGWFEAASAVVLLGVLAAGMIGRRHKPADEHAVAEGGAMTTTFRIKGMENNSHDKP